jgi:hypothetical protein
MKQRTISEQTKITERSAKDEQARDAKIDETFLMAMDRTIMDVASAIILIGDQRSSSFKEGNANRRGFKRKLSEIASGVAMLRANTEIHNKERVSRNPVPSRIAMTDHKRSLRPTGKAFISLAVSFKKTL